MSISYVAIIGLCYCSPDHSGIPLCSFVWVHVIVLRVVGSYINFTILPLMYLWLLNMSGCMFTQKALAYVQNRTQSWLYYARTTTPMQLRTTPFQA